VAAPPNGVEDVAPKPVAAGVLAEPNTPPVAGVVLPNALVVAGRDPNNPPLAAGVVDEPNPGVLDAAAAK
jgi:hypothetical protein